METVLIIFMTTCAVSSVFAIGVVVGASYVERAMARIYRETLIRYGNDLHDVVKAGLARAEKILAKSNDNVVRDIAYREAARMAMKEKENEKS